MSVSQLLPLILLLPLIGAFINGTVGKSLSKVLVGTVIGFPEGDYSLESKLDEAAKANDLIFMNEVGLDPGIDHMSAMKVLDEIRDQGGNIILFESFCGGLVAPESDTNLWNYKFTWNPRNVVLAGQGGAAKFIQEGKYKYIPYSKLFRRTEFLEVEGYGRFEAYANRDSLKYRSVYGLDDVLTLYRGTIRRVGFSKEFCAIYHR